MSASMLSFLAAYFGIVFAFSMLKRASIPGSFGRSLQLFRAFFPSWRFFDRFEEAPVLYYRVSSENNAALTGGWKPCLERLPRKFRAIFHNPDGNYALAAGSLVQQLLSDIESVDESRAHETESLVSYQLAKNLVKHEIRGRGAANPEARYQFKISGESGDLLISPTYSLKER